MGYERNDRLHGRDQGYGYRPEGRGEDRRYERDRSYGRGRDGYDHEDRGFIDRAGDAVKS